MACHQIYELMKQHGPGGRPPRSSKCHDMQARGSPGGGRSPCAMPIARSSRRRQRQLEISSARGLPLGPNIHSAQPSEAPRRAPADVPVVVESRDGAIAEWLPVHRLGVCRTRTAGARAAAAPCRSPAVATNAAPPGLPPPLFALPPPDHAHHPPVRYGASSKWTTCSPALTHSRGVPSPSESW